MEALQDQLAKAVKQREWDIAVEMEESLALVQKQIAQAEKDAKKKGFGAKDRRKIKKEGKLAGQSSGSGTATGSSGRQPRIVGWSGHRSVDDVIIEDHSHRFSSQVTNSFSSDISSHSSRSNASRVSSDGRQAAAREAPEANDAMLEALAEDPTDVSGSNDTSEGFAVDPGRFDRFRSRSSDGSTSFASLTSDQAGNRMLSKREERLAQKKDTKKLKEAQKAALAKEKQEHKAAVAREQQEHKAALAKEKEEHLVRCPCRHILLSCSSYSWMVPMPLLKSLHFIAFFSYSFVSFFFTPLFFLLHNLPSLPPFFFQRMVLKQKEDAKAVAAKAKADHAAALAAAAARDKEKKEEEKTAAEREKYNKLSPAAKMVYDAQKALEDEKRQAKLHKRQSSSAATTEPTSPQGPTQVRCVFIFSLSLFSLCPFYDLI